MILLGLGRKKELHVELNAERTEVQIRRIRTACQRQTASSFRSWHLIEQCAGYCAAQYV